MFGMKRRREELRQLKEMVKMLDNRTRVLEERPLRGYGYLSGLLGRQPLSNSDKLPGLVDRVAALEQYLKVAIEHESGQPARWVAKKSSGISQSAGLAEAATRKATVTRKRK